LAALEVGFVKPKIATLIGERNAHTVQDLLGAYLGGEDAGLAKEAIMALWHSEIPAPEQELLGWLRSAEDHARARPLTL